MTETKSKKWYQSKTIWGVFIAALGYVMAQLQVQDIQVPANADFEQLKAYAEAIKAAEGNIGTILSQLLAAFGSILAIIGRIKAESKLG